MEEVEAEAVEVEEASLLEVYQSYLLKDLHELPHAQLEVYIYIYIFEHFSTSFITS